MKKNRNTPPKYRKLLKTKYRYDLGDDLVWVKNPPPPPTRKKESLAPFTPPETPAVLNSFPQPSPHLEGLDALMKKYAQDIENGRNLQKRFNS